MDTYKIRFLLTKLSKNLLFEELVIVQMIMEELDKLEAPEGLKDVYENERWVS
jgi:hypothetical protein